MSVIAIDGVTLILTRGLMYHIMIYRLFANKTIRDSDKLSTDCVYIFVYSLYNCMYNRLETGLLV